MELVVVVEVLVRLQLVVVEMEQTLVDMERVVVVVEQPLVAVMVVMDLHQVFLEHLQPTLVVEVAGRAQHKHLLEQVELVAAGQDLALLCSR